jgi:hypothetical protein
MKCIGIFLIVFGHAGAWTHGNLTPPIYLKQLGVAFFMFVLGFSLARESRPSIRVVYNRLFEVFLYGVGLAVLLSIIGLATDGNPLKSNYLPFLLGANVVLLDDFPANPTTWFIGTYIHAVLLWALVLRRVRIRGWMIALTIIAEIPIRAGLMANASHLPYMALTNWATVFLMGLYGGQQPEPSDSNRGGGLLWAGALAIWCPIWSWALGSLPTQAAPGISGPTFPFIRFEVESRAVGLLLTSATVTTAYVVTTFLVLRLTRCLAESGTVRFFAANTLIIFLAHMPINNELWRLLADRLGNGWLLLLLRVLVCFLALAFVSEVIRRVSRPTALRETIWARLKAICGGFKSTGLPTTQLAISAAIGRREDHQ